MGFRVEITQDAETDLRIIVLCLAAANPQAALRIGLRLMHVIESLGDMPHLGIRTAGRTELRKLLHGPYQILYRVEKSERTVKIWRVWDSRRSPTWLQVNDRARPTQATPAQLSSPKGGVECVEVA
jgi:plasmid stabilization system protein ParE